MHRQKIRYLPTIPPKEHKNQSSSCQSQASIPIELIEVKVMISREFWGRFPFRNEIGDPQFHFPSQQQHSIAD